MSVHNKYTGYTLKHLLLRHMYNLSLPNLCAMCSSLRALRLPTVTECVKLSVRVSLALYCVVLYIAACVDTSRTVLLGPFSPPLAGETFDTCSMAAKLVVADTQVF